MGIQLLRLSLLIIFIYLNSFMKISHLLAILVMLVVCTHAQGNFTNGSMGNMTNFTMPNMTNFTMPNMTNFTMPNMSNFTMPNMTNMTNFSIPNMPSLNFAPIPEINSTNLFTISNSSQDGRLISSPKLEVLNLDYDNATSMTNITLTVYNRSAPMMNSKYMAVLPGDWLHVESSVMDLSCNMLMEKSTKNMSLVVWDRIMENFYVAGVLPLTEFTSDAAVLNASAPVAVVMIQQAMMVGSMCRVMTYTNGQIMAAYRANAAWTTIHVIVLPTNWNVQTISPDLNYAIADNKLYSYDRTLFSYVVKFDFSIYIQATPYFSVRNTDGRILVWLRNQASSQNMTASAGYPSFVIGSVILYFSFHESATGFSIIGVGGPYSHLEYSNTPNSNFAIFTAPQMSKFGFGVSNGTFTKVYAKHVDYSRNQWFDVQFSEPVHYANTVARINPQIELDFNDFFLVVRNASYALNITDPLTPPVEEVYQMMSSNFTLLRTRHLLMDTHFINGTNISRQFVTFVKTLVDPSVTTSALVLNVYSLAPSPDYQIVEFDYGSFRSIRRVIETPEPSYIYFEEPAPRYGMAKSLDIYQWAYYQTDNSTANQTLLTVVSLDNSTATHTRTNVYTIPFSSSELIYQNPNCKLIKNMGGGSVQITLNRELPNGSYVDVANLQPIINATANNMSIWQMSSDCSRFRFDNEFFYSIGGGNFSRYTIQGNFTLDQATDNLTYATSTDGDLWKFHPNGTLGLYFTPPQRFPMGASLLAAGNRIGLGKTNTSSAWFLGLEDINGQVRKCLNYSNNDFLEQPILEASPLLTKVLMVGRATRPNNTAAGGSGTIVRTDFYFINCPTFQNISLPNTHMQDPANIKVNLGEEMVHVLQFHNSTGEPIKDVVFYLQQNTVALMAFEQPIVVPANTVWVRSQAYIDPFSYQNFLLSEYVWTNPNNSATWRVVNVSEVNGQQAVFNNKYNGSFSATIVNGQIQLCAPGCTDCECTSCLSGYALDTSTSTCRKCAAGCSGCSAGDTAACTSCFYGLFLNASSMCQLCDAGCQSCSGNATSCDSCPPGEFYFSGQCNLCPKNCFECTDAVTCTYCNEGFVVTASGLCRGCSIQCAECNLYNITECTACSDGLFLNQNSQCEACPANCESCGSATSCAYCEDGYSVSATSSLCVAGCQLPCLTCADNNPSYCLTCPANADAQNGACIPNFTCNTTETCTDCGYGLNYILAPISTTNAVCAPCPDLANCIQCDDVDNYVCSICKNGYYLNDYLACSACNSNCTSCWSDTICTGCAPGWTLKKGQTEGRCRACESPCLTCKGKTKYCTSCVAGFTRFGWKCRNNTGTSFTFVLSIAPSVFLADIDNFVCRILEVLNGFNVTNSTDCDQAEVTFTNIATGSTSASGTSSSGSTSNLASGASAGGSLGGATIVSSSVTSYGTETASQSSNIGLIVGLVAGIVPCIVIVIVIVICCWRRRKNGQTVCATEDRNVNIEQTPEKSRLPDDSGLEVHVNPLSQGAMVEKE